MMNETAAAAGCFENLIWRKGRYDDLLFYVHDASNYGDDELDAFPTVVVDVEKMNVLKF